MGRSAKFHKRQDKKKTSSAGSGSTSSTQQPAPAPHLKPKPNPAADPTPKEQKKRAGLKDKAKASASARRREGGERKGPVLGGADYVELMFGGRRKAAAEAAKLPQDPDSLFQLPSIHEGVMKLKLHRWPEPEHRDALTVTVHRAWTARSAAEVFPARDARCTPVALGDFAGALAFVLSPLAISMPARTFAETSHGMRKVQASKALEPLEARGTFLLQVLRPTTNSISMMLCLPQFSHAWRTSSEWRQLDPLLYRHSTPFPLAASSAWSPLPRIPGSSILYDMRTALWIRIRAKHAWGSRITQPPSTKLESQTVDGQGGEEYTSVE